jgi:hypothetical protein
MYPLFFAVVSLWRVPATADECIWSTNANYLNENIHMTLPATVYDSTDMARTDYLRPRTGYLRQYRLWHAPTTVSNSRYDTYVLLFTVASIWYEPTASTGYCLVLAMGLGLAVCKHQTQWCHLTRQFSLLDDVSERHWVDCSGNKKGDSLSSYAQFITQDGSKRSHHFQ